MSSFINEYVIEVNQFPRHVKPRRPTEEWFTIKDYFFYDSNIKEYGHRDSIIPVSRVLNKEEIPDIETMQKLINNKKFVMLVKKDYSNKEQGWYFDSSEIGEN